MSEEKEMSFLGHLEVLRWHLVRSSVAIIICAIIAFVFPEILFDKLLFGPSKADFWTYKTLCKIGELINVKSLCLTVNDYKFINTDMGKQFTWHIWASMVAGIIMAFPYVAWEIWRFVKPALHDKEKKGASGLVFFMTLLFFSGVFFGYYILSPLTINFLLNYNVMSSVTNTPTFTSFFSTILNLVIWTGVVFEMPIIIYFLAKVGLVGPQFLKKYRRHAIVIIMIIAAIITPPDVTSQVLVAIPLLILYEISILIAKRVYKEV